MNRVKVVCALIRFGEQTLVVQRSEQMALPLKWEFPGGKMEAGETEEACVVREVLEELNLHIRVDKRLTPSIYNLGHVEIELIPYLADYMSGDLILLEHKQALFVDRDSMEALDWAPADVPILKEYLWI
jgi:8-oxo-dGTP diphosphatase